MEVELHLPGCSSLKEKRSVIRHLLETARRRFAVSASEVDHHDQWQRAAIGVAVVSATVGQVEKVLDSVERFVDTAAGVEVIEVERAWLELDDSK